MGMSKRGFDIHIEHIALAAMPADGERRLREAVADALARLDETAPGVARGNPRHASERVASGIAGQIEAHLARAVPGR